LDLVMHSLDDATAVSVSTILWGDRVYRIKAMYMCY
jgi:hypothetical protein